MANESLIQPVFTSSPTTWFQTVCNHTQIWRWCWGSKPISQACRVLYPPDHFPGLYSDFLKISILSVKLYSPWKFSGSWSLTIHTPYGPWKVSLWHLQKDFSYICWGKLCSKTMLSPNLRNEAVTADPLQFSYEVSTYLEIALRLEVWKSRGWVG